jgi:5-methylthioribose kinase
MLHAWKLRRVHSGCWCEDLKERHHLEDLGTDGRNNFKMELKEIGRGGVDQVFPVQDKKD